MRAVFRFSRLAPSADVFTISMSCFRMSILSLASMCLKDGENILSVVHVYTSVFLPQIQMCSKQFSLTYTVSLDETNIVQPV